MHPHGSQEWHHKLAAQLAPWTRSVQFWVRAMDIYTGYKVCQLRTGFIKDVGKREEVWERQHELAGEKMYSMCSELGGFFLKAAQILGKPDLAPMAWVKRLVTLCDRAPATRIDVIRNILEDELGQTVNKLFERFDEEPLGSASIAQVHRARLKGMKTDVAVKVQHPGVEHLMMIDIHNLQAFALFLQNMDVKFDIYSVTKEIEKQIGYEFDFLREAVAMEKIHKFFLDNNKKVPVLIPRVIQGMVTKKVLTMDYIDGIPIMNLGNEIEKRGIDPDGRIAIKAKEKILHSLSLAYGQMILKSGFFHADPHPGNILICKDTKVALLDYGQVKDLPDNLRLGFANLVIALANNDILRARLCYKELGIETSSLSADGEEQFLNIAQIMFDTKLQPGGTLISPFADDAPIKKMAVQSFPEELFSVMRTIQLLRGLSVGMGVYFSCAEHWKPIAEEVWHKAVKLRAAEFNVLDAAS